MLYFSVSGKDIPADGRTNRGLDLDVYQCFYKDCFNPDTIDAPENVKPTNFSVWSDPDTWDFAEQGWGGYNGALPMEDQNVKIPSGECDDNPANTKHLYKICTMLDQRRRRWAGVVQMLYKCFCVCWEGGYYFYCIFVQSNFLAGNVSYIL